MSFPVSLSTMEGTHYLTSNVLCLPGKELENNLEFQLVNNDNYQLTSPYKTETIEGIVESNYSMFTNQLNLISQNWWSDSLTKLTPEDNQIASFTTIPTEEYDYLLGQVKSEVKDTLLNFINQDNYSQLVNNTFAHQLPAHPLKNAIAEYITEEDSPEIKIVLANDSETFKGAFSAANNTIYLAQSFLAENLDHPSRVEDLLIEELAHFWQSKTSPKDIRGDEGELLLALVNDKSLSISELDRIKNDHDLELVLIDGEMTLVEKASLAGTAELTIESK